MVVESFRQAQSRRHFSAKILGDGGDVRESNGGNVELREVWVSSSRPDYEHASFLPHQCNGSSCMTLECFQKGKTFNRYVFETRQKRRNNQGFVCPSKLFLPLSPQIRYISERTLEVFTANATGRTEFHHILHPSITKYSTRKVEAIDLTDGNAKHKLTCRDVVERTPFSVHGTLDGRICVARSDRIFKQNVVEVWKNEDPVITVKVNQLDNGLLAATTFQCISTRSSLFVLDLANQCKISSHSRVVFKAVTSSNMLDTCWLWDNPSRLVLSTTDSVRLFDIRCPGQTNQALFVDYSLTHLASNKYRCHVFAAFNGEEVQIYDSRQLFGPIQRIRIQKNKKILSSMKWNPYMPYELLLHFQNSKRVLRCSLPEIGSDPFKRVMCDSFEPEDVISMEQIWDGINSADIIEARREKYNEVENCYHILTYGEMYDRCKEDPKSPMPLCWATPYYNKENRIINIDLPCYHHTELFKELAPERLEDASEVHGNVTSQTDNITYADYRNSLENSAVVRTLGASDGALEKTHSNLHGRFSKSQDSMIDKSVAEVFESRLHFGVYKSNSCTQAALDVLTSNINNEEVQPDLDGECSTLLTECTQYSDELGHVFNELGMDVNDTETLVKMQMDLDKKVNKGTVIEVHTENIPLTSSFESVLAKNTLDNGYRIRLPRKVYSFDFGPVGYSGIVCLLEKTNDFSLMFAPFVAPDEGFAAKAEYGDILEKMRTGECINAIPYHLYEAMILRLFRGMDYIDDKKPEISLFHGLATQSGNWWAEWLVSAARKQQCYNEYREASDIDETTTDPEDFSGNEKNANGREDCPSAPTLEVKGLPGILQLLTLESEVDVTWHDCDSAHFTFIKIARSPVRRMILAPYCLPVSEERIVSDEKFAASTDIPQQMPVLFLCLINGDTIRFIEYTMYIRRKLGKPVHTNNPCTFLNAFYFFSKVVSRYINKISNAEDKSSPKFVARRLRLVDKIEAFVKENAESSVLNPLFIPMLLVILGELTSTHPQQFTYLVINNKRIPMSMRLAWCTNLLSTEKLKKAANILFNQCSTLDRLQFVGLGRHPDSLFVLSEYIYATLDCQIVSHILVAGCCFEEDVPYFEKKGSSESVNLSVEDSVVSDIYPAPSLFAMFPTCYLAKPEDMDHLLYFLRAEFCRYAYILQRMQKYCFRRKLLNLVPQVYWPEFRTLVDISCTFCGYSYEAALRSNDTNASEQMAQVRSRSSVGRGTASRSSASISGASMAQTASMSMSSSVVPFDSEPNSSSTSGAVESLSYDYNGVDGGTEAEIKRAPDSACPQCRKPYPRCSLCGYSYLTPVNDYDHQAGTFSMMFSTCLMCCHGGHTKHLISWFEKEDFCPVLGCDCRCLILENGAGGRFKQNFVSSH